MALSINLADIYMNVLVSLPDNEKIDLASKLLASIKKFSPSTSEKTMDDPFVGFSDSWNEEGTPKQIAEDLRSHRNFSRTVEDW